MFTPSLKSIKGCFFFILFLSLPGCISIGPKYLPHNRKDFNVSLQNSDKEQLLLNLVRMQYADDPYFLGISNISAQFDLKGGASANSNITSKPFTSFASASLLAELREKPTISYVPLQGEEFTRHILAPIKMESIYLLLQSGWSIARILRIATQSINDIPNAPSSARPSTSHIPKYKEFNELAHYLRNLQREDLVSISASRKTKSISIDIALKNSPHLTKDIKKLSRMLKVNFSGKVIKLVQTDLAKREANEIAIQTRSVLGMMYYLSKSVEVPLNDLKKGAVEFPRTRDGRYFDWSQVVKGMMKIYVSDSRPTCAHVSAFYRNRWYYIADNDTDSKETLSLMKIIFALQAGDVKGNAPLLTLPL